MKKLLLLMPECFKEQVYPHVVNLNLELDIITITGEEDEETILRLIKDVNYIIWTTVKFTDKMLDHCKSLEFVQKWGAGIDGINLDKLKERKITFCNVQGGNAVAVAEHFFALIMEFYKQVGNADLEMHNGNWEQNKYIRLGIEELSGKKLGIIGMGKIGTEIAIRALAFNMKVSYYKRQQLAKDQEESLGVKYSSFNQLIEESDILCLALSLNEESKGLIDGEVFNKMKDSSILVNLSRGAIVKEDDLIMALKDKKIKGACLDVFTTEPLNDQSQLLGLDNVILTPHYAGRSKQAMEYISKKCAENIDSVFNNKEPRDIVPI